MTTTIKKTDASDFWLSKPGHWRGAKQDEKRTATVSCPRCGQSASLSGHSIADDGAVSPSLVCPFKCGFHDFVTLEGWTP